MKIRHLFLFLFLFIVNVFSQQFNYGANVRSSYEKGSAVIDNIPKNVVINVIETNSIILFAEVLDGAYAGKKGYIYHKLITNNIVLGQGCSFRSSYEKGSEILFSVPSNTKVKIIKGYYNWYRVSYTNNGVPVDGWISEENILK